MEIRIGEPARREGGLVEVIVRFWDDSQPEPQDFINASIFLRTDADTFGSLISFQLRTSFSVRVPISRSARVLKSITRHGISVRNGEWTSSALRSNASVYDYHRNRRRHPRTQ